MAFTYENLMTVVLPDSTETTYFDDCPRSPTHCDEATGAAIESAAAHGDGWGLDGAEPFEPIEAIAARIQ